MLRTTICFVLTTALVTPVLMADNWPSWRGPAGNGSTDKGKYATKFSATDNVAWKVKLPGKGCNTPIVWEKHIFLTAPVDGKDSVLSYDLTGKQNWVTTIGSGVKGKHRNGSGANPSAVTDGKHVYVYFKSGNLACLDFKGKIVWQKNLEKDFVKVDLFWDLGTSPVLTKDHVVVAVMHAGESFVVAFDKVSGKQAWKTDRTYKVKTENDHGYTTPHVLTDGDKQTLIVWGAEHVTSYNAADGKLIWSVGGFNPKKNGYLPQVGSSVVVDDVLVVPFARDKGRTKAQLIGVKIGGTGDVSQTNKLWKMEEGGTFVPTPAAHNGKVYSVKMRGQIYCVDAKSGKTLWKDAFPRSGNGDFYSSPTIAGGKIYSARDDGTVFVAQIKGGFKVISENKMGEQIIAAPVAVNNILLIRGTEHLYCIQAP
jgi:outer membrane protein assembly factor BamB